MELFSVKMRSSREEEHISGAETIVDRAELVEVVGSFVKRALNHTKGEPDFINVKIEKLKEKPLELVALPVYDLMIPIDEETLRKLFGLMGFPDERGIELYREILRGAAPGGKVMRGAMLVKLPFGERVEPDRERGVRVSTVGIVKEAEERLKKLAGDRYTENLRDALVLATKVLNHPAVLGELCVSDDPDYTTGYITVRGLGYVRLRRMKEKGLRKGGRVFFLKEDCNVEELINYLEKKPVIIKEVSSYSSVVDVRELLSSPMR
ncbi:MAG: 6-carboxyhexanoate--CoA ligase [Desulfurobacteriaceae bacterium]